MEKPSCGTKLEWKSFNNWFSSVDENVIVWRGDPPLQTSAQGVKILGTLIGHEAFVKAHFMARRVDHDVLLERVAFLQGPTSHCTQCDLIWWENFVHRMTLQSGNVSRRSFSRGGLGIQSASRTHPAAFWASWVGDGSATAPGSRTSPWHPVRVHSRCGAVPRGR